MGRRPNLYHIQRGRLDVVRISPWIACVMVVMFLPGIAGLESSPKVDPETGRIRILHFGASGLPARVYPGVLGGS